MSSEDRSETTLKKQAIQTRMAEIQLQIDEHNSPVFHGLRTERTVVMEKELARLSALYSALAEADPVEDVNKPQVDYRDE